MKEEFKLNHYRKKRRIILGICGLIVLLLYAFKNVSFLIRTSSTIGVLILFYVADHLFDVKFKPRHYVFIILIAISSFLLSPLYYISPNYDKIQHFILPVLFGSIVFHMVNYLDIQMKWKVIFTGFVVMGVVGLHEIGEYLLDYFFDLKLQGVFLQDIWNLKKYNLIVDRIDDTMIDMVLGALGALFYSSYRYIFYKSRGY